MKPLIFFILTVITGAYTVFSLIYFIGNAEEAAEDFISSGLYMIISYSVNFVFFIALIFGQGIIEPNPYAYNTTTTTYTYDSYTGEMTTSVSTPEDKAFWAMFWKRIGLVVLCFCTAPVSHLVFLFVLPIVYMRGFAAWIKALMIILGAVVMAGIGILPKFISDVQYGPKELTYYERSVGAYCVKKCDVSAKNIVIPSMHDGLPVTGIADYAFEDCADLKSVTIPDSVTFIGMRAFYKCTSLSNVYIGSGVNRIEQAAFAKCENLWNITYNGTVAQWKSKFGSGGGYGGSHITYVNCIDGGV